MFTDILDLMNNLHDELDTFEGDLPEDIVTFKSQLNDLLNKYDPIPEE